MSIRDEWNRAALAATRAAERYGASVTLNPDVMRIRMTEGASGLGATVLAQIHDVVKREVDPTQVKVEIVGDSIVLSEAPSTWTSLAGWDMTRPKQVEVIQVIKTTLARRGSGKPDSPIRELTQFWTIDGELLLERDPCKPTRETP